MGRRPRTYLGFGVDGFPNLFIVSGPGARRCWPTWCCTRGAVNWIADGIAYLDDHGYAGIEATGRRR